MDQIIVEGNGPLKGEIPIAGAKNACLTLMPATLLTDQPLTLTNAPRLSDIRTMTALLGSLGAEVASLQDGQVLDAHVREKGVDAVGGIAAGGDGQHLKIIAAHLGLQPVQRRHFLSAGRAPCRPEIHQQHLALPVGKGVVFPVAVGDGGVGQRCGGLGDDQLFQPAVARGLPVGLTRAGGVCTDDEGRIKQGGTQHVTSEGTDI